MANRFDNFDSDPVLTAAKILEVGHWPNDHEQLSVFGEEEINALSDHFKQLLERNDFKPRGGTVRMARIKSPCVEQLENLRKQAVWQLELTDFTQRLCNVLMLIEILLFFPYDCLL